MAPKGSQAIQVDGFTDEIVTYSTNGFIYWEGKSVEQLEAHFKSQGLEIVADPACEHNRIARPYGSTEGFAKILSHPAAPGVAAAKSMTQKLWERW